MVLLILLASCSANKYLKPGEKFFEGFEVEYVDAEIEIPKDVRNSILSGLEPEATRRFFLSRPGTWIYYQVDSVPRDKGLKYFIKYRLGNKPSLLQEVKIDENRDVIESRMKAAGFFNAHVEERVDTTKHRASVVYRIEPKQPYYFDTLQISSKPHPWSDELRRVYGSNLSSKKENFLGKTVL